MKNLLIFAIFLFAGILNSCAPEYQADDPFGGNGELQPSSSSACVNPSSYGSFNPVTIGGQTWMKENLNYAACGSRCYNDDPANCATYGRLYDWATAMNLPANCNSSTCSGQIQSKHRGVCPAGWHIPSNDEWNALASFIESDKGCFSCNAEHLKAASGWDGNSNGLDSYGFKALPGGVGFSDGSFNDVGSSGNWWSASEYNSPDAYGWIMYFYHYIVDASLGNGCYKNHMFSVRCLQD